MMKRMRRTVEMCAMALIVDCGGKVSELASQDTATGAAETETQTPAETTDALSSEEECVPSDRLVQHVCTHTENGPYISVAATANTEDPPDVSRLHGAFDVSALTAPARFRYDASRTGKHIVFTDAEIEWSVLDASGNSHLTQPVAAGFCAGTTSGRTFDVDKGQSITLDAAAPPARFALFIEHVATFGDDALVCTPDQ